VLALLTLAALAVSVSGASAAGYEPNDSIPMAAGPLLGAQSYVAQLETKGDRDVFYFYVTSRQAATVSFTLEDMGGGSDGADIDTAMTDGLGTPLTATAFVNPGEARMLSVELKPQKYFLEVTPGTGFGDSYRITAGADGLGPYSVIAGRCGSARAATKKAKATERRARVDLQRAVGRLRLSRYVGQEARRTARRHLRQVRSSIRKRRRALRAARESQAPWCSIPE
jgi:hypothetical protein